MNLQDELNAVIEQNGLITQKLLATMRDAVDAHKLAATRAADPDEPNPGFWKIEAALMFEHLEFIFEYSIPHAIEPMEAIFPHLKGK